MRIILSLALCCAATAMLGCNTAAPIKIPYTTTAYSITYKSSINLNESGGQIHRNDNGWIQNLNRNINAQLAAS